jgi:response regulator RpfG family c-di-GMP phosphodiesterase
MAKQPFNVAVADMRMPQMDGVQFLQQVSEKSHDTVRMLTEILSVATPDSFGHAMWLRDQMRDISRSLKLRNAWELVIAATLSRVGYATLPSELVKRALDQHELSKEERDIISRMPQISHDILRHIPRLEGAAKIVLYQEKNFDGSGFPDDACAEAEIPLGARTIRILNDLAHLSKTELSKYKLTKVIKERRGCDHAPYVPVRGYFIGALTPLYPAARNSPPSFQIHNAPLYCLPPRCTRLQRRRPPAILARNAPGE